MIKVTQRAVARGFARSASIARRARTSAATDSARLSNTLATPAPRRRAPKNQVRRDQVPGRIIQVVGEHPQRLLGRPAGPEPGHQPGYLRPDRVRRRPKGGDQRLLQADPDGQHPRQ